MKLYRLLTAFTATAFISFPLIAPAQNQAGDVISLPHTKMVDSLINEAGNADTQEGLKQYSRHLIEIFIDNQVGDGYLSALSNRLAMAELMTRHGKRKYIPEASVAQAFNDLMKGVSSDPQNTIHTDATVVHTLRLAVRNTSPALSTLDSHEDECLPSEATFLMMLLLTGNGTLTHLPPAPQGTKGGAYAYFMSSDKDSRSMVFRYIASHPHSSSVKLYDHISQLIGF